MVLAGQRNTNAGADQGFTGPKFLGVREMTYRLAFIASSTQVCCWILQSGPAPLTTLLHDTAVPQADPWQQRACHVESSQQLQAAWRSQPVCTFLAASGTRQQGAVLVLTVWPCALSTRSPFWGRAGSHGKQRAGQHARRGRA